MASHSRLGRSGRKFASSQVRTSDRNSTRSGRSDGLAGDIVVRCRQVRGDGADGSLVTAFLKASGYQPPPPDTVGAYDRASVPRSARVRAREAARSAPTGNGAAQKSVAPAANTSRIWRYPAAS